jgi:hypothetical protein
MRFMLVAIERIGSYEKRIFRARKEHDVTFGKGTLRTNPEHE